MILDPILRFNWIFYAIYAAHELQHSAILSFFIALSEIVRRGIWVLFRVENEHCTNVSHFRAQRDVPLPYHLNDAADSAELLRQEEVRQGTAATKSLRSASRDRRNDEENTGTATATSGAHVEPQRESAYASLRKRHQIHFPAPVSRASSTFASRFARIIHGAHAQDFERKRKSAVATPEGGSEDEHSDDEDDREVEDDDDEEDNDEEDDSNERVPREEAENEAEMVEAERTAGQLGESVPDARMLGARELARRDRADADGDDV